MVASGPADAGSRTLVKRKLERRIWLDQQRDRDLMPTLKVSLSKGVAKDQKSLVAGCQMPLSTRSYEWWVVCRAPTQQGALDRLVRLTNHSTDDFLIGLYWCPATHKDQRSKDRCSGRLRPCRTRKAGIPSELSYEGWHAASRKR